MLIAVCIKLVLNPQLAVKLDPVIHRVMGLRETHFVVNPADLAALEVALRIKDQVGAEVTMLTVGCFVPANTVSPTDIALTTKGLRNSVGRLRSPDALRRCLAMGADRVIVIGLNEAATKPKANVDSSRITEMLTYSFRPLNVDSMMAALVLARCIRRLNADLVVCGDHSYDQGNGLVGPAIAEFLGMALTTAVLSATVEPSERSLLVRRRLQRGNRELVQCMLPAVITVDTGPIKPRYFTFPALFKAFKTNIETLDLATLRLSVKEIARVRSTRLLGLYPPRPRTKKVFIPDSSLPPEVRARLIMSGGISQDNKSRQLLEGNAEQVAAEVVRFLQSQGILPPG